MKLFIIPPSKASASLVNSLELLLPLDRARKVYVVSSYVYTVRKQHSKLSKRKIKLNKIII